MRKRTLLAAAVATILVLAVGVQINAAAPDRPAGMDSEGWMPITDELGLNVTVRPDPSRGRGGTVGNLLGETRRCVVPCPDRAGRVALRPCPPLRSPSLPEASPGPRGVHSLPSDSTPSSDPAYRLRCLRLYFLGGIPP